jgi:ABC-type glycerol-3-phosphate transport system substrate-binding protein
LLAACVAAALLFYRSWLTPQPVLREAVRNHLVAEQAARTGGDLESLFALYAGAERRANPLAPGYDLPTQSGSLLQSVEEHGDDVWATVAWQDDGKTVERLHFYAWRDEELVRVATDPAFWSGSVTRPTNWGELRFREKDQLWSHSIVEQVTELIRTLCEDGCAEERLPLTVTLSTNWSQTAVPGYLRVPSPRLVALDASGLPAAPFWSELERRLTSYLAPARIRFAVPASMLASFEEAAEEFSVENSHVIVEIVALEALAVEADRWLAQLDGALIMPTRAQIAAGLVRPLDDFRLSDRDFEAGDFHPPVARAVRWQQATWAVPHAAELPLIYLDANSFARAEMGIPSTEWNWHEWEETATQLIGHPSNGQLSLGMLETGSDALFAHAFSLQCERDLPAPCGGALTLDTLPDTLAWYRRMVDADLLPDVSDMTTDERRAFSLAYLSWPRSTARWVEYPNIYEHHYQLGPVSMANLPGNGSPLRVSAGVVSASSAAPQAVWEWLNFLSRHTPLVRLRAIPARPSVASSTGYWAGLPVPLQEVMVQGLATARPIGVEEAGYFSPAILTRLMGGDTTATELAAEMLFPPTRP